MKDAGVGAGEDSPGARPTGFEMREIAAFLRGNAERLEKARPPEREGFATGALARESARALREIADDVESKPARLEDLERRLTVMEEKLFAALLAVTPDSDLVSVRSDANRDIAPYLRNQTPAQLL